MKASLRVVEAVSATSLMSSKYLLSLGSVWGWYLSILGYVLATFFNMKIGLKIASVIVGSMAILCTYGLYKWSSEIKGLQIFDLVVIGLSCIFSVILIISEIKQGKPLWIFQTIANVLFTFAFIALGLKLEIAWYALLVGHINNTYMYYKKQAYIIAFTQVVSIVIALVKIIG